MAASLFGVTGTQSAEAFESHPIHVSAILRSSATPPPTPPPSDCPEALITGFQRRTALSYPDQTLRIASGAVLEPEVGNLRIDTGCDLIIEAGAEVRTSGTTDGALRFDVGRDFIVSGNITASSTSIGGSIIFTAARHAYVTGSIHTSGADSGGGVIGTVGGNLTINGNSVTANATTGDGGLVRFDVTGRVSMTGPVTARSLSGNGGVIRVTAGSDITVIGSMRADGGRDGGKIRLTSERDVSVNGDSLSVNGGRRGGNVNFDAGRDLQVSGVFGGNGGTFGGMIVGTVLRNADISGRMTVDAEESIIGMGGSITLDVSGGLLKVRGSMTARGALTNGRLDFTYCTKDFTGATFAPAPSERATCAAQSSTSPVSDPPPVDAPAENPLNVGSIESIDPIEPISL